MLTGGSGVLTGGSGVLLLICWIAAGLQDPNPNGLQAYKTKEGDTLLQHALELFERRIAEAAESRGKRKSRRLSSQQCRHQCIRLSVWGAERVVC